MKSTIFFSISAIIYILLLLIVFFSKKYYKTLENKIYSLLIITSFFGLVIELLGVFILNNTNEVLSFIQMKLYQIYLLTWIGLFTLYTIASTKRNNKENDWLTFTFANKNDIWLHTKDIQGSHVIIKTLGLNISDDTLVKCAKLAVEHSKAKLSSNVPVDYCKVQYVKKPNSAKPGMVIFTNNKTISVTSCQ